MSSKRMRCVMLLLGVALLSFFSNHCHADTVVVDFDNLSGTTPIPPTFTSPTSPSFDVTQTSGPIGSIQLDNANHGGIGTDFELRLFWGAGATSFLKFERSNGQLFDFSSFDYEAQAGGASFTVAAYRQGKFTGGQETFTNGDLGTHDFSGNSDFQDIDELRISIGMSASQTLLDNFTFNADPVILFGDVNLDGMVNLLDVDAFIDRLSSGIYQAEADCNEDGVVNLLDVDFFIAILGGG